MVKQWNHIIVNAQEHISSVQRRLLSGEARDPHHAANLVMIIERVKILLQDLYTQAVSSQDHFTSFHDLTIQFGLCAKLFKEMKEWSSSKEARLVREWNKLHDMGSKIVQDANPDT